MKPLAAIAAIALIAVLAGCGGSDSTGQASSGEPEIVSADSLRDAAKEAPLTYWAGEQSGTELELSEPGAGRKYVRYLTGDAEAGDKRAAFLTVGTYVQPHAAASLRRQAKRSDGFLGHAPGGATVYYERGNPRSVYLAYPGTSVEVEVFDPSFRRALRLVEAGRIVAVH